MPTGAEVQILSAVGFSGVAIFLLVFVLKTTDEREKAWRAERKDMQLAMKEEQVTNQKRWDDRDARLDEKEAARDDKYCKAINDLGSVIQKMTEAINRIAIVDESSEKDNKHIRRLP